MRQRPRVRNVCRTLIVVAAVVAWLAPPAAAAERPSRGTSARPFRVRAGTLRGVVKSTDGKPYVRTKIELFDRRGNLVAKTVTNDKGEYVFKNIRPGKYSALIADRVRLPLTMTRGATVSRLMIIRTLAPRGGPGFLGLSTWTWVAIGGGAAVAVATPLILANRGGGHGGPVSP